MKRLKLFTLIFIVLTCICLLTACSEAQEDGDIVIVYTNDTHSHIANEVRGEDGTVIGDGLRFSKVAAIVNDMKQKGQNVLLVDAGDELQGDVYGAFDEGASIIDIMNETGYVLATPGNHDFDYGIGRFFQVTEKAGYEYISCNFVSTVTDETVFEGSRIFEIGGKKIAFVGISTPEIITSSTPVYFQDENGEYIYTVRGYDNSEDLYLSVQNEVDEVKDEVDYVIALAHVGSGMDEKQAGWSSEDIISHTTGIDAFISGHSHSTIEEVMVKNREGKDVLLTQTGNYLAAVGVMTITSDGRISSKLITEYGTEDENVAKLEKDVIQQTNDELNEKIGTLETPLFINNPTDDKQRLIRSREMNLGDFTADSVYWYFNQKLGVDCDIAVCNGGGIRAQIETGDLSYMSAKSVEPFGNMVCLTEASGQEIIDALEMGTELINIWDEEWNAPAENGGFLQVAGILFTVDGKVKSNIVKDSDGMFKSVDGEYRVKDVKVYNRDNGQYEPIDTEKIYTIGGADYLLRNSGNGLKMFGDNPIIIDHIALDYMILAEYIQSFAKDGDYAKVCTINSPLMAYKGYLLNYESPYGSGRINIINVDYE